MPRPLVLSILLAAVVLPGCSHLGRMRPIVESFEEGEYAAAAAAMTPLLEDRQGSEKDRTLYELEAGAVFAAAGELGKSIAAFGAADERVWEYLDVAPEVRVSEQVAAILGNQTVVTYVGRPYDRIMCTTYQALNHLAQGDLEAAGVSLRRAYEWQRDAADRYAKEIAELERKADEASFEGRYDPSSARDDPEVRSGLDSAYGPLRDLRSYAEFAVPYATYLQAIRFQLTGRQDALAQATVAFRRVAGMLPEADRTYAEEDARIAEASASGAPVPSAVWVLVEAGMGPRLEEFRLDIPLFLRGLPYVGAAFPVLRINDGSISGFTVRSGASACPSRLLTDMDRVVGGDFNRRLPAIIAMTIASSATKAIATYFAQRAAAGQSRDAPWVVAIAGAIYQVATNSADLRIWLTLPKKVLYARLPAPPEGPIEIELGDGQRIGPIAVESNGATIVHLRAPRPGAPASLRTMRFPLQ